MQKQKKKFKMYFPNICFFPHSTCGSVCNKQTLQVRFKVNPCSQEKTNIIVSISKGNFLEQYL